MASSNNDELISKASPHTVKKFELVEAYITDSEFNEYTNMQWTHIY